MCGSGNCLKLVSLVACCRKISCTDIGNQLLLTGIPNGSQGQNATKSKKNPLRTRAPTRKKSRKQPSPMKATSAKRGEVEEGTITNSLQLLARLQLIIRLVH